MAYNRLVPFNRQGIVGLETTGAELTNGNLVFYFEAHPYVNTPFNGLLLIHLKNTATGLTGTEPVFFETQGMSGTRKAVTKAGGGALTAQDITVPSYALFFYDFRTNIVEKIN